VTGLSFDAIRVSLIASLNKDATDNRLMYSELRSVVVIKPLNDRLAASVIWN